MEGGNGVKALVCPEPLASFLGDAGLGTFEVFEGYAAQGNDDFGRNKAQLLVKDAMGAESGFFRRWCPVVPRPALNDVCCKDMVPCDFDGPERLIQELSAGADKGTAIVILDAAWSFADNDEGTVGIPKPANGAIQSPRRGQAVQSSIFLWSMSSSSIQKTSLFTQAFVGWDPFQENARNKSRKDTCGNSNADEKGQVAHKGCALHEHHGRKDLTAVMGEGTEDANADAGKPILLDGKGHEKKTQDSTGKSNAEAWGKKAGKKEACQKDPRCKKKGRPFRSVEVEDDDGHGIGKAQMGSRQRQQVGYG